MSDIKGPCPGCGASDVGGPIPEDIVHHYVPWEVSSKGKDEALKWLETNPWPTWGVFKGIEVRGVYDGVLIWECPYCDHKWPRFSYEQWGNLHEKALNLIAEWKKEKSNG